VPLLERRRPLRRALAGGVVLGAFAGVLAGIIDAAWVLATAAASFDGAGEMARYFALALAVVAGAGALAGIAEGMLFAAVGALARALQSRRADADVLQAVLVTALATPPIALGCTQIFAGPRARTIAHHDLYAVAIGLAALAAVFAAARVWQRLARAISDGRMRALAPATAFILAALILYTVDQRVLYRLYPFFHVGLKALVFVACQLAVASAQAGPRRRFVEPTRALVIGCLTLSAAALAAKSIAHQRALRTIAVERAALAAPLVKLLHVAPPPSHAIVTTTTQLLPEGPRLATPDVFLITVDAMRADRLTPRTAPFLASLADRGVDFPRAYAQVPHTSFSIATLLTGKFVYSLSQLGLDAAGHQTLAEIMKRERYKTAAFYPPAVFTIDRERLKNLEASRYGFEYVKYEFMDAPGRTDQVIHFLESEKPERAFVWVHYFDPHEPYELHPGAFAQASTALDRYDGEVHFVDGEIARLVTYLQKTRPHALIVVAADHGEEFGEHGGRYHGTTLYEEQVRVPLFMTALDGALPAGVARVPVGLVDVAPTILSLVGITPSARMRGHDLGPWLLSPERRPSDDARGPLFAEIARQKMIVDGNHKLVCDFASDSCSAFDLGADPGEHKNRIDEPWASALRGRLEAWMQGESLFEDAGGAATADARAKRAIETALLGDNSAAPELAAILGGANPPLLRRQAAELLAQLAPDPSTRAALLQARNDPDEATRRSVALDLLRLGDATARPDVIAAMRRHCADPAGDDVAFCARAALATNDVPSLATALEHAGDDEALAIALIGALGRSHDPRALAPLTVALGGVRTRLPTVNALLELHDARILPTLLPWLPNEPYVPVRARMVTLVAALAHDDPAAARDVLRRLLADEREAPVMAALLPALASLGDRSVVPADHARAVAGQELWLAGSGSGTLAVTIGGTHAMTRMSDGAAHLRAEKSGAVSFAAVDGDPTPRWAVTRAAPSPTTSATPGTPDSRR
jgi:arylsulfatase A-like enzyme